MIVIGIGQEIFGALLLHHAVKAKAAIDELREDTDKETWAVVWYSSRRVPTLAMVVTEGALDIDIQWGTNALVSTSSIALSKDINFDSLKDTPARNKVGADQRYGQSKLALRHLSGIRYIGI
ncbi:hypothetical protein H0H93_011593 [Arthromyces matolae]|nr:hypothetical protein H0H93_011593 [Arthromyces matolae]